MTVGDQPGVERVIRALLEGAESRPVVAIRTRAARWLRAVANRLSPPEPEIVHVRGGTYQVQCRGMPLAEIAIDSGMISDTRAPFLPER